MRCQSVFSEFFVKFQLNYNKPAYFERAIHGKLDGEFCANWACGAL